MGGARGIAHIGQRELHEELLPCHNFEITSIAGSTDGVLDSVNVNAPFTGKKRKWKNDDDGKCIERWDKRKMWGIGVPSCTLVKTGAGWISER